MCYDIKVSLERQLKVARHYGDEKVIDELTKKLLPLLNPIEREFFQVSGFTHPKAFILSKDDIQLARWGLIPHWVHDSEKGIEIQDKTLNARAESMFDKPSFKEASLNHRGVLFVDGFYEHKHVNKQTYPYFIQRKDHEQMAIGALFDTWLNPVTKKEEVTFSIVTTKANTLMTEIHNNPKLSESRMPLILEGHSINRWLEAEVSDEEHSSIDELSVACKDGLLEAHTVRRFKGKDAVPNSENAAEEFLYPELGPTLFD